MVAALGIPVAEIPDWNCCGASSGHTTDHLLGVALPARNLALAEAQGFDRVLAPCAACYNRLASARLAVAEEDGLAERMPEILGRPFANTVEVFNAVQLLHEYGPLIEEKVAASLAEPNPLHGVKLAAYYGCLLVRPPELSGDDDPEQPMQMDDIINACGADDVEWNMKVECCGGAFSISRTKSVVRLGRSIIEDARRQRRRGHRGRLPALPQQPRPAPEGDDRARRAAAADPLHHAGGGPRPRPAGRDPRPRPPLRRHRAAHQGPRRPRRRARRGREAPAGGGGGQGRRPRRQARRGREGQGRGGRRRSRSGRPADAAPDAGGDA